MRALGPLSQKSYVHDSENYPKIPDQGFLGLGLSPKTVSEQETKHGIKRKPCTAAFRFMVSCSKRSLFDHLFQHEVLCSLSYKMFG